MSVYYYMRQEFLLFWGFWDASCSDWLIQTVFLNSKNFIFLFSQVDIQAVVRRRWPYPCRRPPSRTSTTLPATCHSVMNYGNRRSYFLPRGIVKVGVLSVSPPPPNYYVFEKIKWGKKISVDFILIFRSDSSGLRIIWQHD